MRHLAIIADGNRRWAASPNLHKEAGHVQGLNWMHCLKSIAREPESSACKVYAIAKANLALSY